MRAIGTATLRVPSQQAKPLTARLPSSYRIPAVSAPTGCCCWLLIFIGCSSPWRAVLLRNILNTKECLLCSLAFYRKKKIRKKLTADLNPLKKIYNCGCTSAVSLDLKHQITNQLCVCRCLNGSWTRTFTRYRTDLILGASDVGADGSFLLFGARFPLPSVQVGAYRWPVHGGRSLIL